MFCRCFNFSVVNGTEAFWSAAIVKSINSQSIQCSSSRLLMRLKRLTQVLDDSCADASTTRHTENFYPCGLSKQDLRYHFTGLRVHQSLISADRRNKEGTRVKVILVLFFQPNGLTLLGFQKHPTFLKPRIVLLVV